MTLKRKALEVVAVFSMVAVETAAYGASASHTSKTIAGSVTHTSSSPEKAPRWNPTKPAGLVDLDKESYAAFVVDQNGKPQLVSKSPKIALDAPRALASHMKLLTASVALDAMEANPALKTSENMLRLRRGLLESSNGDMEALALAVAPVHTLAGVRDMLRKKGNELKLSTYFDPQNASGNPIPLANGTKLYTYGTIEDDLKIAVNLYGDKKKREILQQEVYSDIKKSDHATNFLLWTAGNFLLTKTATADGETKSASGAGFRTMMSFFDNGQKQYYFFHPNSYADLRSPSSTAASIIDQVLKKEGVQEDPRLANWLQRVEQTRFPAVGAAIDELQQRLRLPLEETVARFSAPALPKSHGKSHYSKRREGNLNVALALNIR